MDVPVLQLLLMFVVAVAALALLIVAITQVFLGHKRGFGYTLGALFVAAWLIHLFTGWQAFAGGRAAHGEIATVFGEDGYV